MTLTPEDRKAIIQYRIERAFNTIEEAEFVITGKYWNLAADRLYYSLFYICEALLLSKKISTSTHAGLSRMINLHFVRTGILSEDDKDLMTEVFRMRQSGDYDDLSDWTEKSIVPKLPLVKNLVNKINSLIDEEYK